MNNKFDEKFNLIMEAMGSEAYTLNEIYDLYMNIVLDAVQDTIRNIFGKLGNLEIEYEKTYSRLFWSETIDEKNAIIKYQITIDDTGNIKVKAFINDEQVFENTLVFDSIKVITDGPLAESLTDAISFVDEKLNAE